MSATYTYDPKEVTVAFGPILMHGFAEGSFVEATRDKDTFSKVTGSDGETTRSRSNDRSGRVTITLMDSSDTNALLAAVAVADEVTGNGVGPLFIRDRNGNDVIFAEQAWIVRPSDVGMAQEAGTRVWIFDTGSLTLVSGGKNQITGNGGVADILGG